MEIVKFVDIFWPLILLKGEKLGFSTLLQICSSELYDFGIKVRWEIPTQANFEYHWKIVILFNWSYAHRAIRTIKYCLVSLSLSLSLPLSCNRFSRKPHIGFPWFFAWMLVLGSVKKWSFCFFAGKLENWTFWAASVQNWPFWLKMVKNAQNRRFSAFVRKPHIGFP